VAGTIVVGIDGSEHARAALRFAAEEARLRGARLLAVHAWTFIPPAPIGEPGMIAIPAGDLAGDLQAERAAAEATLDRAVREALPDTTGLQLERLLVEDEAGQAIVEAAKEADLVVVGTRARGTLARALLGSVSEHVLRHAPCPVVIVRAPGQG
jgi:nucleotide-binding universal stress UspA family protein